MRRVCAWCGARLAGAEDDPIVSHGMCLSCARETFQLTVECLTHLDAACLDRLPFGVIRLRGDGRVLAYNRVESELARRDPGAVIGRNFFNEVAPCTNVGNLAGWLADARRAGEPACTRTTFVFDFAHGEALVSIALTYSPDDDMAHLLIEHSE